MFKGRREGGGRRARGGRGGVAVGGDVGAVARAGRADSFGHHDVDVVAEFEVRVGVGRSGVGRGIERGYGCRRVGEEEGGGLAVGEAEEPAAGLVERVDEGDEAPRLVLVRKLEDGYVDDTDGVVRGCYGDVIC